MSALVDAEQSSSSVTKTTARSVGVKTTRVVMELAEQYDVEMPIAEQMYHVCNHGRPAEEAYRGLLSRRHRAEMHGLQ